MSIQDRNTDSYRSSSRRVYLVEGDGFVMRSVEPSDRRFEDPARTVEHVLVAVRDVYNKDRWDSFHLLNQPNHAKRFIEAYKSISAVDLKPCRISERRGAVIVDEEASIEVDYYRFSRRGSGPGAVELHVPYGLRHQPPINDRTALSVKLWAHDDWRALFCEAYYDIVCTDPEARATRIERRK